MEHAPTPYTAAEIEAGCPVGRVVTTRLPDGTVETTAWLAHTADGCRMRYSRAGEDGTPLGDAIEGAATWAELRDHAAFPAASTSISEEAIDTPLGRLACLRYDVRAPGRPPTTLWFAVDLPGMPVRVDVEGVGTTMEMLSSSMPS